MITYTLNPEINTKIHKLLKLGVPPIPVAPKVDSRHPEGHHIQRVVKQYRTEKPEFTRCDGERIQILGDYCNFSNTRVGNAIAPIRGDFVRLDDKLNPIARFTGKNPSYLDWNSKPRICSHGEYQKRLPTEQEIKKWFSNPNTGLGTLGGHNGIAWIDFDAKNYPTQEDCDRDVQALLDRIGKPTLTEKTGSGGYRVAVVPIVKPTFTNFSSEPGGKLLGEALFDGRYTVLAPSKHPNGNYYKEICDADPVEVESLEAIGLYPSKDEAQSQERVEKRSRKGVGDRNTQQTFSDPAKNPWDIRNFALFFEGYTERVDGWGYAKCPAHNGTSLTSFRVRLDTGEFKAWCGCNTKAVYEAGKRLAESFGYKFPKTSTLINSFTPHPHTQEDVVYRNTDSSENSIVPDTAPVAEKNYVQKAEEALYLDGDWVSIAGQLYRFNDRYYELQPDALEQRRIREWLNTYSEEGRRRGVYEHKRAKSSNVNEVFQWMVFGLPVDQRRINTEGLNCSNGIVQISDDGTHVFHPHSPDQIYTYEGCKYDPTVDSSDCDRLLECLDPPQREIFLRTAAAALHLKLTRSKIGNIKGLLCYGSGSNGKDTLRTALAAVLGQGMTSKTLQDFKGYDAGRKFTLAGLESSICNWASENSSAVKLDSIQSLKQFITGDPLEIERKGKDAYSYEPSSIFLGNCNELPTIASGLEAIRRRYAILTFGKTYKRNADLSKGELEADPRLKNDPEFVRSRIAPALLNKMLARLPLVLTEGIDYQSTDKAMQEAQENSRHLWAFVRESGLEYDGSNKVYVGDLYQILEQWYLDNGWLTVDDSGDKKPKKLWESESQYDPPVKKSQDLYLRLRELFPHIERRVDTQERKGSKYIFGIKLGNSSQPSQPLYTETVSSQPSSQPSQPLSNSSQPLSNSSQPSYTEQVSAQETTRNLDENGQKSCDDGCDETRTAYNGCDGCDEISKSVEFCNPPEVISGGSDRDVPVDVSVAIADIASLKVGDKIITSTGTDLVEIDHIKKPRIYIKMAQADKFMIQKAFPKASWMLNGVACVYFKEFKTWVDLMHLRVVKAQAIPETNKSPEAIAPQIGDEVVTETGIVVARIEAVGYKSLSFLPLVENEVFDLGNLRDGKVWATIEEFNQWIELMKLKIQPQNNDPDWQPGDKLLMTANRTLKKYEVEFVGFKYELDGSYKAIVLDEGKQVEWAVDRLSRPEGGKP